MCLETRLYLEAESDCVGLLPSCAAPAVSCQLLISLTREPRLATNRPMEGECTSWHARGVRPRRPCGRPCEILKQKHLCTAVQDPLVLPIHGQQMARVETTVHPSRRNIAIKLVQITLHKRPLMLPGQKTKRCG